MSVKKREYLLAPSDKVEMTVFFMFEEQFLWDNLLGMNLIYQYNLEELFL